MMKFKFILAGFLAAFMFTACTDFGDLNVDKKNPSTTTPEALITNAQKELVDITTSISVNDNVFRLYSQHWAQTTYPDESQYQMVVRNIPDNLWNVLYRDVLRDLKEAKGLVQKQQVSATLAGVKANQLATIELLEVYAFSMLVDMFGDVPYSDALDVETILPKYQDANEIYTDLINRAVAASSSIVLTDDAFGSGDLIYAGDAASWKKFGNSLALKLAIRIADANNSLASETISKVASSAFESNDDNATMTYLSAQPNTNPVYADLVLSGRNDFVGANTLIDKMNELSDPRRSAYFEENLGPNVYEGGIYGSANGYANFTHMGAVLNQATTPGILMTFSEVCFLKAEALERGYTVNGSAADWYHAGIKASGDMWTSMGASVGDMDGYIAQGDVNYATASGDWKTKIGTQKWISLFNQGLESWTEWRRLDAPTLNVVENLTYDDIPRRLIYPINEQTLNGSNWTAASGKITGGDVASGKIFWDKN